MQYTSNYNLAKPEADDIINPTSRSGYNDNFDTLDTTLKSVSDKANANEGDITDIQGDIADINAKTGDDIPFESGSADSISDKITILSNNVSDLQGHDYIVEQGTSGIWYYRKWNSGTAECWGRKIVTNLPVTISYGAVYYYNDYVIEPFPNNLFVGIEPNLFVSCKGQGLDFCGAVNPSTTNASFLWFNAVSYTLTTGYARMYAIGRWK